MHVDNNNNNNNINNINKTGLTWTIVQNMYHQGCGLSGFVEEFEK